MNKTGWVLIACALAAFMSAGCSSSGGAGDYSKDEAANLRNPPKTLPKQLGETMKMAAEDQKKKMAASQRQISETKGKR